MDNFVGAVYTLDINTIKFDTIISTFNREQSELEYNKTLESIKTIGQVDPIYIDGGYCCDGRHRYRALKELGTNTIKVIDINPKLTMAEKLSLSNRDLVSGRDLTKAQLAIQAFKYGELTGTFKSTVARKFGIGVMQLTFASEVKNYMPEAYESIIATGKAKIGGKYTASLQAIYRYINSTLKEGNKVKDKNKHNVDYDKLINTEQGKEVFWQLYNENRRPDIELAEHLIQYVNLRFVIEE